MTRYELRPLSTGEILDAALGIYRARFAVLVSIAVVTQGIPTVLNAYAEVSGGVLLNPGLWFLAMVLGVIGGLVAAGATVWVISETYLGREAQVGDALRYAFSRAGSLLVAGIVKYLLVAIGLVLFLVPGIIVLCGLSVVSQIVVLERLNGPASVGRAWELTRGYRGKAFGLGVVVLLLLYLPIFGFGIVAAALPSMAAPLMVVGQALGLVIYPVVVCTFTLYYYDLRVRKEAFDLELLHTQLTGEFRAA